MSKSKIQGPSLYERDCHGLLTNANYVFNEDGSVNWRAMIKPEFLYPNKGWFDIRNKPMPESIEGLDDKQLLIMLGGIKELAKLRGFNEVRSQITNVSEGYVVASCSICWQPNYESNMQEVVYEDVANATTENTDSFCVKFLETIAANRAFVRCVRNFLNIHIVGADEIDRSGGKVHTSSEDSMTSHIVPITPSGILEKTAIEKLKINSFEDFKKSYLRDLWQSEKYRNTDASNWKEFGDIPAKEARLLLAIINKQKS
jgi:hypothetical protein